ncbi:uncharacterized protein LOC144443070 [Glandiceps talaboti]
MFKKKSKKHKELSEWTKYDDKVLHAVENGDLSKLQSLLGKKGTSPTKLDHEGKSALHAAAKLGHLECLDFMLHNGADLMVIDNQGRTALHCASRAGHGESIERLLQYGAAVFPGDYQMLTPLHHAAIGGHYHCALILIDYQSPVDPKELNGKTPLCLACQMGNPQLCKELLDKGANINTVDDEQKTPLMYACEHGNKEVVELLVKKGAKVNMKDKEGFDAFYFGEHSGHPEITRLLEKAPSVATWDVVLSKGIGKLLDKYSKGSLQNAQEEPRESEPCYLGDDILNVGDNFIFMTDNDRIIYLELEEENEQLNEDLTQTTFKLQKAEKKIRSLEKQLAQSKDRNSDQYSVWDESRIEELEHEVQELRRALEMETNQKKEAYAEIEELKEKLLVYEPVEQKILNKDNDDSWGDSDEDLFNLPATSNAINTKRKKINTSDDQLLAHLRGQIVTLRLENDEMKTALENTPGLNSDNRKSLSPKKSTEPTVSLLEYKQLQESSVAKIHGLEEVVISLKNQLSEAEQRAVVSIDDYEELQVTNEVEVENLQTQIKKLRHDHEDVTQRLAEVMEENANLMDTITQSSEGKVRKHHQAVIEINRQLQHTADMQNKHIMAMKENADKNQKEIKELTKLNSHLQVEREKLAQMLQEQDEELHLKEEQYQILSHENDNLQKTIQREFTVNKESERRMDEMKASFSEQLGNEKQKYMQAVSQKEKLEERLSDMQSEDQTQIQELISENAELQDTIHQQALTLSQKGEEVRNFHELTREKEKLEQAMMHQSSTTENKNMEINDLQREKEDLEDTIQQQTRIIENTAKRIDDLIKEREKMDESLKQRAHMKEDLAKQNDNLLREKVKLQDTVKQQSAVIEDTTKRIDDLMRENQNLGATIKRQSSLMVVEAKRNDDLLREKERLEETIEHQSDIMEATENNIRKFEGLLEENNKLQERIRKSEASAMHQSNLKQKYLLVLAENEALKDKMQKLTSEKQDLKERGLQKQPNGVPYTMSNSTTQGKRYDELYSENQKLKDMTQKQARLLQLERMRPQSPQQVEALQKQVTRLQQQLTEVDGRYRDTISTYRTHLLSAIQGDIDPAVREALKQIVKLRSTEQFC